MAKFIQPRLEFFTGIHGLPNPVGQSISRAVKSGVARKRNQKEKQNRVRAIQKLIKATNPTAKNLTDEQSFGLAQSLVDSNMTGDLKGLSKMDFSGANPNSRESGLQGFGNSLAELFGFGGQDQAVPGVEDPSSIDGQDSSFGGGVGLLPETFPGQPVQESTDDFDVEGFNNFFKEDIVGGEDSDSEEVVTETEEVVPSVVEDSSSSIDPQSGSISDSVKSFLVESLNNRDFGGLQEEDVPVDASTGAEDIQSTTGESGDESSGSVGDVFERGIGGVPEDTGDLGVPLQGKTGFFRVRDRLAAQGINLDAQSIDAGAKRLGISRREYLERVTRSALRKGLLD